jgi:cell division transport system ATP-binding protein
MIEFSGVTKKYKNGTEALKNVSMKLEKGEFVFVVGSSGAGKSTLIKTLLREEAPTSGTVFVNGYNLSRMKRRHIPKFRRSLGVVFQDFRLIPNLNVYDNVAFALRVTNVVSKEIRVRVPYVLKLLGLADKAKCFPDQISGGEQQRVALARALVNNPAIIIADEPTGNIDPELSFEIVDLLSAINEQAGTTIVMVTHEHELVNYFNKRVITIEDGMVVSDTLSAKAGLFTGHELMEDYSRGLTSKQKAQDYNKRAAARQQQPAKPQPPRQPIDFSRAKASDLMQDYDDAFPSGYQFNEFNERQDLAFGRKS